MQITNTAIYDNGQVTDSGVTGCAANLVSHCPDLSLPDCSVVRLSIMLLYKLTAPWGGGGGGGGWSGGAG